MLYTLVLVALIQFIAKCTLLKIEKMKKNEIRGYISIRQKLKIEPRMIHSELVSSLGASAPSLRTLYRRAERF